MTDYYTKFCTAIEALTLEEREWCEQLRGDEEALAALVATDPDEEWVGFMLSIEDHADTCVVIESDETGDTNHATAFIQEFLTRFRPDDHHILTWANTCSRPMIDGYSGGGAHISASGIRELSAWDVRTGEFKFVEATLTEHQLREIAEQASGTGVDEIERFLRSRGDALATVGEAAMTSTAKRLASHKARTRR